MFRKRNLPQTKPNAALVKTILNILFTASLIVFSQNAYARRAPTLPNAYDGAIPGARSLAMGCVGTGMPLTNESVYYNSAALGNMFGTRFELGMILSRSSNAMPNEVAVYEPSGSGLVSVIAINKESAMLWNALSDYTYTSFDQNGSWKKNETYINSLTVASGKKNDRGFNIGLNLTYLYGKIGETSYDAITTKHDSNIGSGNGFTFDLSFMYPAGQSLFFGINFKNIAGFMFWDDYNMEQLPLIIKVGTAYVLKGFVFAVDYDKKFYRFGKLNEYTVHMGIEQYLNRFLCLRGGIISDNEFENSSNIRYSYGIGLKIKGYEADFSGQQYKTNDEPFSKFMLSLSAMVN